MASEQALQDYGDSFAKHPFYDRSDLLTLQLFYMIINLLYFYNYTTNFDARDNQTVLLAPIGKKRYK